MIQPIDPRRAKQQRYRNSSYHHQAPNRMKNEHAQYQAYLYNQNKPNQPQLQSHHNIVYYKQQSQTLQYSYQRHQTQLRQQQYYHQIQARSKPIPKQKHSTKQKEKPLLNQSCSLPEDDEVLRASVYLLDNVPQVGDGYSSDNALFYGQICTSKQNKNNKIKYLKKLGKETLTHKFSNIDPKDQLAIKSSEISTHKTQSHTLYNVLTKKSEDITADTYSDDSLDKVQKTEIHRKEVIRTRQKMRRREADDKSFLLFKYGSVGAVLCNLSASTLGCSVLCIPYVFSLCGCVYGCIIIIITVLLQLISMRLLLQCQKCTGVSSIQMLSVLYLKNKCGILFIHMIIFGYCFTQCIAILIALADLIEPVLSDYVPNNSFVANRTFLLVMTTLVILLPLSFLDKPSHLRLKQARYYKKKHKKHSSQSINRCRDCLYNICMIYFLCAITIAAMTRFYGDDDDRNVAIHTGIYIDPSATIVSNLYSFTLGFPIVLYCLTTHTELFKVNAKLSYSNRRKLPQIAHGNLIQHTLYILILGICGYFYFCADPKVQTNIILNLKEKSGDIYMYVSMAVIGFAMFLFYPTVLQPSVHSISVVILSNEKPDIAQHVLLTLFVDIFALIIALFIKDLAVLFAWSGAIFGSILSLILPGLLFWNIIVSPSKTFVDAMTEYEHTYVQNRMRKTSNISKHNINTQSLLNSIIATATPPLMNYARTVNDDQSDDKCSLLSGSHLSHNVVPNRSNDGSLPHVMTPDSFNQMLTDSHSRLYGTAANTKQAVIITMDATDNEEKYDGAKYGSDISHSVSSTTATASIISETQEILSTGGHIFNSDYVSLSSHTKRHRRHVDSDCYAVETVPTTRYKDRQKQAEISISRSTHSPSKTRHLKEMSKSVQERIETQLKEEKIQRIKALERVNQSWTFWFDQFGALLVLISGVILFVVGNACNVLHIVYT